LRLGQARVLMGFHLVFPLSAAADQHRGLRMSVMHGRFPGGADAGAPSSPIGIAPVPTPLT